jgi:hypothetical protein
MGACTRQASLVVVWASALVRGADHQHALYSRRRLAACRTAGLHPWPLFEFTTLTTTSGRRCVVRTMHKSMHPCAYLTICIADRGETAHPSFVSVAHGLGCRSWIRATPTNDLLTCVLECFSLGLVLRHRSSTEIQENQVYQLAKQFVRPSFGDP